MAPPDKAQLPSGIRGLMGFCLFASIYALADLILGGYAGHLSSSAIPESPIQRAASIVVGLSYAPLFYLLLRRSALAWKFGWIVFAETLLSSLWIALASAIDLPAHSGRWGALTGAAIGISFVFIYWGRWWMRQRQHFSRSETPTGVVRSNTTG